MIWCEGKCLKLEYKNDGRMCRFLFFFFYFPWNWRKPQPKDYSNRLLKKRIYIRNEKNDRKKSPITEEKRGDDDNDPFGHLGIISWTDHNIYIGLSTISDPD